MKSKVTGKKSYLEFFAQFSPRSQKTNRADGTRFAASPRADKKILEELNFMNVAYLSDN